MIRHGWIQYLLMKSHPTFSKFIWYYCTLLAWKAKYFQAKSLKEWGHETISILHIIMYFPFMDSMRMGPVDCLAKRIEIWRISLNFIQDNLDSFLFMRHIPKWHTCLSLTTYLPRGLNLDVSQRITFTKSLISFTTTFISSYWKDIKWLYSLTSNVLENWSISKDFFNT